MSVTSSTGKTIGKKYQVVEQLGEGGMGVVYRAMDTVLQRQVAIKMLHPAHSKESMLKTRFHIEALITASLDHPSIVTMYDFFDEEGVYFIVMQYLEGKTGKELIEQEGPIPGQKLIHIFAHVTAGLAYAHSRGIIHRDIKPNNIMITASGQVKLMDFGIARAAASPQLTQAGFAVGSALYMSPEQIKNQRVDLRSDIYSLGITMFEMATGKPPFYGPELSEYEILAMHINSNVPLLRDIDPSMPENLERVIVKATRKDPADRYQLVEELRCELLGSSSDETKIMTALPEVTPVPISWNTAMPEVSPAPISWEDYLPPPVTKERSPADYTLVDRVPKRQAPSRSMKVFIIPVMAILGLFLIGVLISRFIGSPGPVPVKMPVVPPATVDVPHPATTLPESSIPPGPQTSLPQMPERQDVPAAEPHPPDVPAAEPHPQAVPAGAPEFRAFCVRPGKDPLELKDADTLTMEDRYYLELSMNEQMYLYVAQVDSSGIMDPIFPNRQFSSKSNPVAPRIEYRFPEEDYFYLGGSVGGKEFIYVVASKDPNNKLDLIFKELQSAKKTRAKQLSRQFVEVFDKLDRNGARMLWFWHR